MSQDPDHRAGLFGCVDLADQRRVFFGSGSVAGTQVDQRRAAVEKRQVQQSSDLVGGKHEHGPSPQQPAQQLSGENGKLKTHSVKRVYLYILLYTYCSYHSIFNTYIHMIVPINSLHVIHYYILMIYNYLLNIIYIYSAVYLEKRLTIVRL